MTERLEDRLDRNAAARIETFGSAEAGDLWAAALNALHAFAQASDCLPGDDVIEWFANRTEAYQNAVMAAALLHQGGEAGE